MGKPTFLTVVITVLIIVPAFCIAQDELADIQATASLIRNGSYAEAYESLQAAAKEGSESLTVLRLLGAPPAR